jgi:putative phosphoribosyl transferase
MRVSKNGRLRSLQATLKNRMKNYTVTIPISGAYLEADIVLPENAEGLVLFIHGTGSGRHSTRNGYVAGAMHRARIATMLLDMLTIEEQAEETRTGRPQLDMSSLGERGILALDWLKSSPATQKMKLGLFGASTGAAAALIAAASRPDMVAAMVSRGGRPDLAEEVLPLVRTPVLFIVGKRDAAVLAINKQAMKMMETEVRLEIVPGASHLFEEAGALDKVAELSISWFDSHLYVG